MRGLLFGRAFMMCVLFLVQEQLAALLHHRGSSGVLSVEQVPERCRCSAVSEPCLWRPLSTLNIKSCMFQEVH